LDIRWSRLSQTARRIATRWADRPERKPPTFQFDTIVHSVRQTWETQKSLAGLSNREMRWLPHAIFHPEANRDAWLAQDVTFMAAALSSMRERGRAVRSLLRNVIRLWPKELTAAPQIQNMLNAQLPAGTPFGRFPSSASSRVSGTCGSSWESTSQGPRTWRLPTC
jgi:hypothetical protein